MGRKTRETSGPVCCYRATSSLQVGFPRCRSSCTMYPARLRRYVSLEKRLAGPIALALKCRPHLDGLCIVLRPVPALGSDFWFDQGYVHYLAVGYVDHCMIGPAHGYGLWNRH